MHLPVSRTYPFYPLALTPFLPTWEILSQPALKQAVITAVNQRAGPDSIHASAPTPDSIPFSKLGLSGMNSSAKGAFTQYLESGKSTIGMAHMKTMFNDMKDSSKTASYIDNKLRGFLKLVQYWFDSVLLKQNLEQFYFKGIII